jgi:hypothetical protein
MDDGGVPLLFCRASLSFINFRFLFISLEFLGMLILNVGLHARDSMSWIVLEKPFP